MVICTLSFCNLDVGKLIYLRLGNKLVDVSHCNYIWELAMYDCDLVKNVDPNGVVYHFELTCTNGLVLYLNRSHWEDCRFMHEVIRESWYLGSGVPG